MESGSYILLDCNTSRKNKCARKAGEKNLRAFGKGNFRQLELRVGTMCLLFSLRAWQHIRPIFQLLVN